MPGVAAQTEKEIPMTERRVTAHGKQVKLDGEHLADARSQLAAEAIANALQYAGGIPPESEARPIKDLLI